MTVRPRIDTYQHHIDIEGQRVYRPDHISVAEWMDYWEGRGEPGGTTAQPAVASQ